MDGIDAALLQTDGEEELLELEHVHLSYSPEVRWLLKGAERAVKQAKGNLARAEQFYVTALQRYLQDELQFPPSSIQTTLIKLSTVMQEKLCLAHVIQLSTRLHADAVNKLLTTIQPTRAIDVIGYHGQTVLHNPAAKISLQLGDGALLAQLTGIRVVNNFRAADIAAGGQGAPLAPLYHQALAKRDGKIPLIVVNCGGIANLTLIPNAHSNSLIGFDTGPGNGLIDTLVKQRTQGKQHMDKDGLYGRKGQVHPVLLKQLFQKALAKRPGYLTARPPKSLDIRDFTLITELESLSLVDACATLEFFTAKTIVDSLHLLPLAHAEIPKHWILCGGGWYNPMIREHLVALLQTDLSPDVVVETADEAGWNSHAMEAQMFAYFAVRSLRQLPLSVPGTTGVPIAISGGEVHEPLRE